jgi:ZIP family zinc transporter
VLAAAFWGLVAGSALLLGGFLALHRQWSTRMIGLCMAFGSGVLISSVAFELVGEALEKGGGGPTTLGMTAGALTFFFGDMLVSRRGAPHRKRASRGSPPDAAPAGAVEESNPMAIVLGAVLDGVPEAAAIGVSLLESGRVGGTFVIAVFLSNVPEALSATAGLADAGRPPRSIMRMWWSVTAVSALTAAAGYALLDGASDGALAALSAYAAGAVLTMVASTMLPEAHRDGGPITGLVTSGGFLLAVLIGTLSQAV